MGIFGKIGGALKAPLRPLNRAAQPINRAVGAVPGFGGMAQNIGNAVGPMMGGMAGPTSGKGMMSKVGLGPSPNVMPQMTPPPALNTSMPPPPADNQQDISQIYSPQVMPQTDEAPIPPPGPAVVPQVNQSMRSGFGRIAQNVRQAQQNRGLGPRFRM